VEGDVVGRFTILGLMGLVFGLAVAIAALRNADDAWAGGMLLGTALLVGVLALRAFYAAGRERAWRLGFVVFAGGYFALAFLGLSESNLGRLPTTWLLMYVHQRVAPPQTLSTLAFAVGSPPGMRQGTILTSDVRLGLIPNTLTTTTTSRFTVASRVTSDLANRWRQVLPGAANYEAFSMVGHCLFAQLAGLLGALIALWSRSKHERAVAAANPAAVS
jgi:hypothetical protein